MPERFPERRPREGDPERGRRDSETSNPSPPAADRPPRSLLPPRNHVLQDGSAQVLTTQDGAGSLLPATCSPHPSRSLGAVGSPSTTLGPPLLRAGDNWISKPRAAVEELSKRKIGFSGMCSDVCSACTALGNALTNPTVFRNRPGACGKGETLLCLSPNVLKKKNQLCRVKTKQRRHVSTSPSPPPKKNMPQMCLGESGFSAHPEPIFS